MMHQDELDRFALICLRYGLSADQFLVGDDDYGEVVGGHAALSRDIVVTHLASAARRRYRHDLPAAWLDLFEADVRRGHFGAGFAGAASGS